MPYGVCDDFCRLVGHSGGAAVPIADIGDGGQYHKSDTGRKEGKGHDAGLRHREFHRGFPLVKIATFPSVFVRIVAAFSRAELTAVPTLF